MKLSDYEYYRTDLGVLYKGDCLEILPLIKDKVDLILTDPPFGKVCYRGLNGIGRLKEKNRTYESMAGWGECKKPSIKDIKKIMAAGENYIIWGGNYFLKAFNINNGFLVWDKVGERKGRTCFADIELGITSFNHVARKFTCRNQGWLKDSKDEKINHPTPKPTELFLWCLSSEKHTKENDLVLDCFMGSGTTAVACEKLNRRWIGIELNEKYCEIAKQRIKNEYDELKLLEVGK